jgi:DNA uptake protein ComE-like DNA-binding protein
MKLTLQPWIGTTALGIALAAFCCAAGCGGDSAEREAKIREEAAKAAAQAKPVVEEAGRAVKAAAEGAKEGWEHGSSNRLDINDASEEDLTGLPGIDHREARRIMANRPYHDTHELVSKRVMGQSLYDKIKDDIRAD